MVNIMENPIFSWMIWGKPIIFGNTLISFSWKGTAPFCLEAIRDFYNVSHASLFRKHHSHHFHGNLHQHTHNSHPKRAQFSMTFPPQQKNPATWVHISTTWGLQHYQYDLYFDGRSFWNVFQSWTHWSFSGDSGGSSAHTERRGRTHEETTNGTAVVVRSQPFSCCWSCGRVLRFCLVETCGLGGGFEIYVYKYWRIPFVFYFGIIYFSIGEVASLDLSTFSKDFPIKKWPTKNSGIDFGTRRTWILVFFFFSLPLAPANGQEHRWSLSTVTVTSPSFSEDLFGVENWVEDSGSLTLSFVFFVVFNLFMPSN